MRLDSYELVVRRLKGLVSQQMELVAARDVDPAHIMHGLSRIEQILEDLAQSMMKGQTPEMSLSE